MRIRILGQYGNSALLLLWVADIVVLLATCRFSCWVGNSCMNNPGAWFLPGTFSGFASLGLIAMGLYSPRQRERVRGIILRVALALVLGALAAIINAKICNSRQFTTTDLLLSAAIGWLAILAIRACTNRMVDRNVFKKRVLVYGSGQHAQFIAQLRRKADRRGFVIKGYVAVSGEAECVPPDLIVRSNEPLLQTVAALGVDEIVVAMDDRRQNFPTQELLECRMEGVQVTELLTFLERETGKLYVQILSASWLIFSRGFRRDVYRRYSERVFDLLVSFTMLVCTFPLMLLVALAIKLEDGWSAGVFYRQPRVGFAGRVFDVVKFRSMRVDAEKAGAPIWASADDERVTRVGALIRKFRLDELPQLLTVLKGKMSFVGPRPERPEFVEQLAETIPFFRERHFVKPGITGWAQLCYPYGASEHDAQEKLQYDLYYVKNHGLLFDILILLQTVEIILLGKGAR